MFTANEQIHTWDQVDIVKIDAALQATVTEKERSVCRVLKVYFEMVATMCYFAMN